MDKKRLIVSIDNLPEGVMEAIRKKYPNGYGDYVIKVPKGSDDFFHAITVDTENASYLVKVKVKIDTVPDTDDKEQDDDDNVEIDASDASLSEDPEDFDDIDD
ncbi:MAG: hypothetical protein EA408_13360 [Marinilabiliales bacterium]|nr:MAG: hypothetical protein EA408_13360 [Marinilabiliales bacterium]